MKPLRELKRDPRLKITGQNQIMLHFGYHTYEGVIKCKQFSGTVEFGYDEGGLMEQADRNLIEETTDVMICLDELGLKNDPEITLEKRQRFLKRWEEKQKP
ncbi:MAG: hypothetical protein SPF61_08455 [Porcincola intestinalis]|nr:hypothetical protein [Porcincola intestinalis]